MTNLSEKRNLEIACFNFKSAIIAAEAGADRIELCGGPPSEGGLTPSFEDLQYVKSESKTSTPVFVMIRPRGGNFAYDADEIEQMKKDVEDLQGLADGFVLGMLTSEGAIDIAGCKEMLSAIGPDKPCTFHRAFDEIDPSAATSSLNTIRELGFAAILTSGCARTAVEGVEILRDLSRADEPSIIVGGGVRSSNIEQLMGKTTARWFHSSAITDNTGIANKDEILKLLDNLEKG